MRVQDPVREGFCWDHGFYSARTCPRCSKGGSINVVEEPEAGQDTPPVDLVEKKQLVHDG